MAAAIPPAMCPLPRIICSCCPSMRFLQRTSIVMMRSRTIRHSTITSKRVTAKLPINIPPPERRRSGGCGRRLQLQLLLLLRGFVVGVVGLLLRYLCVWCCARLCCLIPRRDSRLTQAHGSGRKTANFPQKIQRARQRPARFFEKRY